VSRPVRPRRARDAAAIDVIYNALRIETGGGGRRRVLQEGPAYQPAKNSAGHRTQSRQRPRSLSSPTDAPISYASCAMPRSRVASRRGLDCCRAKKSAGRPIPAESDPSPKLFCTAQLRFSLPHPARRPSPSQTKRPRGAAIPDIGARAARGPDARARRAAQRRPAHQMRRNFPLPPRRAASPRSHCLKSGPPRDPHPPPSAAAAAAAAAAQTGRAPRAAPPRAPPRPQSPWPHLVLHILVCPRLQQLLHHFQMPIRCRIHEGRVAILRGGGGGHWGGSGGADPS